MRAIHYDEYVADPLVAILLIDQAADAVRMDSRLSDPRMKGI
jgi:hypothetical protein